MGRLTGEVAIVTGASTGIGATIAKALGAAGAAVAVNYASSKEGADRVVGDPGPAEQIRTPRDSKGDRAMKTRSNLLRRIHALSSLTWAMGMMLITAVLAGPAAAQYPPLSEYLMPRDAEIALARSAAPANISGRATIKVLTKSGYEVAHKGDNGFVCMVMRGWTAPTFTPAQLRNLVYVPTYRAPICFDPGASRTVMPYYELRSKLGMESKTPDQIAEDLQAAYDKGKLPRRDGVSFAYMWSADQNLGPEYGHWHPHMMVFTPYYDNSMLGDNEFGSPLPQVTDDAGTPFTVVVIPVDHKLAIKAQAR